MEAAHPVPTHSGQELPPGLIDMPTADLLLGYQQRALGSASTEALLVIEKSRRIGLTWGIAAHAVLEASAARDAGGKDFLYISYSQEMTREFIDACAMWARSFAGAVVEVGDFMFDDTDPKNPRETRQIKAFRISFASGFEIVALSSAPRSLRGKQGAVCIDEAAFVDNLDELLKAALALLMWGGQVIVVSTHNGIDNPFNVLLDEIKAGRRKGATLKITFDDAMADGLYERICLVTRKTPTPEGKIAFAADIRAFYGDAAAEELDCIPSAGAGSFIHPALVAGAQDEDAGKPELYQQGACYGGRDIAAGRGGDQAIMWVFEMVAGTLVLRERREDNNVGLIEQEKIFNGQFERYKLAAYGVDQTGMGEGEVERAREKHGERVQGFILSSPLRLTAANALLRRLENGTMKLPDDPAIRSDFNAVKKTRGKGDKTQLVYQGKMHPDRFWAAALAALVAESEVLVYSGYQGAPATPGKFDERGGYDRSHAFRMRADEDEAEPPMFGAGTV